MDVVYVNYSEIIANPHEHANKINSFLGKNLNVHSMVRAVDNSSIDKGNSAILWSGRSRINIVCRKTPWYIRNMIGSKRPRGKRVALLPGIAG